MSERELDVARSGWGVGAEGGAGQDTEPLLGGSDVRNDARGMTWGAETPAQSKSSIPSGLSCRFQMIIIWHMEQDCELLLRCYGTYRLFEMIQH